MMRSRVVPVLYSPSSSAAQYIVESARQRPAKRRLSSGGRKSLHQKLYELYMEECEKEPELKVRARKDLSAMAGGGTPRA